MLHHIHPCTSSAHRACRLLAPLSAPLLASLLGIISFLPAAHAQQKITVTSNLSPNNSSFNADSVSSAAIERFTALLRFSPHQAQQALSIHRGYAAAYRNQRTAMLADLAKVEQLSNNSGDHSVFAEKLPAIQSRFFAAAATLETNLFADLKSIASPAQADLWSQLEAMRRRDAGLRSNSLSGEGLDLISIVHNLNLPQDQSNPLTEILQQYEREMDSLLIAQSSNQPQTGFTLGTPIDIEQLNRAMSKGRESAANIRDLNKDTARKIETLLAEPFLTQLRDEVRLRSYPSVFRPARGLRDAIAALALSDLTPDQRETLEQALATYHKSLGEANNAWVNAIQAHEASQQRFSFNGQRGEPITLSISDEPSGLLTARKARRILDESLLTKVSSLLTLAQREKLPLPTDSQDADLLDANHPHQPAAAAAQPGQQQPTPKPTPGIMIRRPE